MRNKRFLSTVVATALVVTTMAMPVMAAANEQSGSLDVDVTTKTGVLRVQVPTTLAVAVDQFEIGHEGAQIASDDFPMTNMSEMDVKVGITSTVTLGTGITLATAKEGTKENEAWLAVAAMTGDGSYDIASTTDVTENAWDLTEANDNVTTFGENKAEQTFYLAKSAGDAVYKLALADENGKISQYAQFYKLTSLATQPTDDSTLQTAVDAADIYYANAATEGTVMKKIAKGTAVDGTADAWVTGNTYYTAEADVATTIEAGEKYVYQAMDADGGKAGFTYIGKLSNEKDVWSSDDIKKINISYNITGVTASKYAEVLAADTLNYGFYKEAPAEATVITFTADGLIKMATTTSNFKSLVLSDGSGSWEMNSTKGSWNDTWNDTATELQFQLNDNWMTFAKGKTITATLTLKDDTTPHTATVEFPE